MTRIRRGGANLQDHWRLIKHLKIIFFGDVFGLKSAFASLF
jgi:hypothetical protein